MASHSQWPYKKAKKICGFHNEKLKATHGHATPNQLYGIASLVKPWNTTKYW